MLFSSQYCTICTNQKLKKESTNWTNFLQIIVWQEIVDTGDKHYFIPHYCWCKCICRVYKANTRKFALKTLEFLKVLGMQLIEDSRNDQMKNAKLSRKLSEDEGNSQAEKDSKRLKKSRRCSICPRHQDRKTFNICMKCQAAVCLEHVNMICKHCMEFQKLNF